MGISALTCALYYALHQGQYGTAVQVILRCQRVGGANGTSMAAPNGRTSHHSNRISGRLLAAYRRSPVPPSQTFRQPSTDIIKVRILTLQPLQQAVGYSSLSLPAPTRSRR